MENRSRTNRISWARMALLVVISVSSLMLAAPTVAGAQTRHHHRRHHRHHHRSLVANARIVKWTSACPNALTPTTNASPSVIDSAVVCLINEQRRARGLPTLKVNSQLNTMAQNWSASMVANDEFDHSRFTQRLAAVNYNWQSAGENIATGYRTPWAVVVAWMASPDHCSNILNPYYDDVGTGFVNQPVAGWASGPSTWTQDFGLSMSESSLSSNTGPQSGCPYNI